MAVLARKVRLAFSDGSLTPGYQKTGVQKNLHDQDTARLATSGCEVVNPVFQYL